MVAVIAPGLADIFKFDVRGITEAYFVSLL